MLLALLVVEYSAATAVDQVSLPCQAALEHACAGARRASAGNCLVCASTHQRELNRAGCKDAPIDVWCSGGDTPPSPPAAVCDVTTFGAVGDNRTVDTVAVQQALRSCHAEHGGPGARVTVRFPAPGRYLIGPVNVSSNTTLFVDAGATIVGLPHRSAYPRGEPVYGKDPEYLPLIGSWDTENVAILGANGTIDGNGWAGGWYENRWLLKGWEKGPRLIGMFRVRGLRIGNLTLCDGARWHVHPVWCHDVKIHDLHIFAPREHAGHPLGGNDGIDPDSSSKVTIERVYIDTGDDAISIKSVGPGPCTGVHIRDATLISRNFAVGAHTTGGMSNILLEDSRIGDDIGSSAWGIKFKTQGTGHVENITLRRLRLGRIVAFPYYSHSGGFALQMSGDNTRNISIEDVVVTSAVTPGSLAGDSTSPLVGLTLRNFTVLHCEPAPCRRFGCKDVQSSSFSSLSPPQITPKCTEEEAAEEESRALSPPHAAVTTGTAAADDPWLYRRSAGISHHAAEHGKGELVAGGGLSTPLSPECCTNPVSCVWSNVSDASAATHLKYLSMDNYPGGADTDGWTSLGYIGFVNPKLPVFINETELEQRLRSGSTMMFSAHGITVTACIQGAHEGKCFAKWREQWIGNATHGGIWNTTIKRLAAQKKLIGVYVGDEILGSEAVSQRNLTAIFELIKATWPTGVVYYNEEYDVLKNGHFVDSEGVPWKGPPAALDWISFDFYSLTNSSWLMGQCDYPRLLYPRMHAHQRVLLLPGGFGSTSGPRGGCMPGGTQLPKGQTNRCAHNDPISCWPTDKNTSRLGVDAGLRYEIDTLLMSVTSNQIPAGQPGSDTARRCWNSSDYDNFNARNAMGFYEWARRDTHVVGINLWPWGDWLPIPPYKGLNMGLKSGRMPQALEAWKSVGRQIRALQN